MTKTVQTEKARQGHRGRHVLAILVGGLLLAGIVWAGVEIYGNTIETERTDNPQVEQPANPG